MTGGEGDQPGALIHLGHHDVRFDASEFPRVDEPDLDALFAKREPRVDVGGIVIEVADDVVALSEVDAGGDEAQSEGRGADQGDFVTGGAQQIRGKLSGVAEQLRQKNLLIISRAGECAVRHCPGHAAGQGTHGGVGQKNPFPADGEFLLPEFFVVLKFLDEHGREASRGSSVCKTSGASRFGTKQGLRRQSGFLCSAR
jgi:hypothetical protein